MAGFSKRQKEQFSTKFGRQRKFKPSRGGPKRSLLRRWRYLKRKIGSGPVFFVVGVLVLLLVLYGFFFSPLLRIREVDITFGSGGTDLDEIALEQVVSRDVLGKNLLLIRKKNLYNLLGDVTVREIMVEKEWPQRLAVRVEKRTPQAILEDSSGNLFLVDEEGVVFGKAQKEELPVIHYPVKTLSIGDEVGSREVNFVLYLLSEVGNAGLDVENIQAARIVRLDIKDGPLVILPSENRAVERMVSMVKEFQRQERKVTKIDLRFQNPVVEYSE